MLGWAKITSRDAVDVGDVDLAADRHDHRAVALAGADPGKLVGAAPEQSLSRGLVRHEPSIAASGPLAASERVIVTVVLSAVPLDHELVGELLHQRQAAPAEAARAERASGRGHG